MAILQHCRFHPLLCFALGFFVIGSTSAQDNTSSLRITGNEFSVVMFDDVTQLDLIQAALGGLGDDNESTGSSDGVLGNLTDLISDTCLQDTALFLTDLLEYKKYALQMRASSARPIDLVDLEFTHRGVFYGDFELCDGVKVGRYSSAPIDADPRVMNVPVVGSELLFGVCCPQSCNDNELTQIVTELIKEFGRSEAVWFSSTSQVPWNAGVIISFFLIGLFLALVVAGTFYDLNVFGRWYIQDGEIASSPKPNVENGTATTEGALGDEKESTGGIELEGAVNDISGRNVVTRRAERGRSSKALLAFSLATNAPAVLSLKRPESSMGALDGIRVLSMIWIIWHHVKVMLEFTLENRKYFTEKSMRRIMLRLSTEGHLGVDSFFVLSALLVTYLTLCKIRSNGGRIRWWRFYLNRYLRLTPVYAFCIIMYVSFSHWLGRGYLKNRSYDYEASRCRQYVWSNLLYINNCIPDPFVLSACLGWTWYLADDMQMFVVTPLFFYFLSRAGKEKIGVGIVIGVAVVSMFITMACAAFFGQPLGNAYQPYNHIYQPGVEYLIYSNVLTRIQSYMVGVFCGYILYKYKGHPVKIPKAWNTVGWSLSITVAFICVFALGFSSYENPLPAWFAAAWHGCHRFLFSCTVGWIAFACVTGNGGPIGKFLSWEVWLPLSRVSYCVYLFHPVVMLHYVLTSNDQLHWNTYTSVYMFLSFFVATYTVSLAVSLLVEVPLLKMTKLLLDQRPRTQ
ncbi:O-acyltransferase like protein-like [Apostichopus japonicus]|uniref:O-acyltransferase like protein-like n=1 Tax=Stichopus japonicus TaxID=307972 RepID=UPI003AB1E251